MKDRVNITFFRVFIVTSAVTSFIFSFTYIGIAYLRKQTLEEHPLRYEILSYILPIMLGLWNAIVITTFGLSKKIMIISGFMFGVFLSHLGTYIWNMPVKIFNFPDEYWYIPLLIAPPLYTLIFSSSISFALSQFFKFKEN